MRTRRNLTTAGIDPISRDQPARSQPCRQQSPPPGGTGCGLCIPSAGSRRLGHSLSSWRPAGSGLQPPAPRLRRKDGLVPALRQTSEAILELGWEHRYSALEHRVKFFYSLHTSHTYFISSNCISGVTSSGFLLHTRHILSAVDVAKHDGL